MNIMNILKRISFLNTSPIRYLCSKNFSFRSARAKQNVKIKRGKTNRCKPIDRSCTYINPFEYQYKIILPFNQLVKHNIQNANKFKYLDMQHRRSIRRERYRIKRFIGV